MSRSEAALLHGTQRQITFHEEHRPSTQRPLNINPEETVGDEWLHSRNGMLQVRQAVSLRTQTQPGPSPGCGLMLKAITLTPREIPVTTMPACEIGTVIIPPLGKMRLGKMRLKQEKIVKSGVKNVSTVLHWLVQILALSPSSCVSLGTSFDIL